MRSAAPLLLLGLLAGCSMSPYAEGPTLGENPDLLGPNLDAEFAAGEFFIGPGDKVALDFWDHEDLNREDYVVSPAGTLKVHLVKEPLRVQGMTVAELEAALEKEYSVYLKEPSLRAVVTPSPDYRKVIVLGQVTNRGVFPLTNPRTTILDILAQAGDISGDGDRTGVLLMRRVEGRLDIRPYDLELLFEPDEPGVVTEIPIVKPGDVLYVLRKPESEWDQWIKRIGDLARTATFLERTILLAPQTADTIADIDIETNQ